MIFNLHKNTDKFTDKTTIFMYIQLKKTFFVKNKKNKINII